MSEVKIKIQTLRGSNLVNDNTTIQIVPGSLCTTSRIDDDTRVSVRDFVSGTQEIIIKLDAVSLGALIECATNQ